MKRGLLIFVLVWAIVSTGLAIHKTLEVQKIVRELTVYKQYAYENNSKVKQLQSKIKTLEKLNDFYKEQCDDLLGKYIRLKHEMDRKNVTISELKRKIECYTKVPYNYYDSYFPKHNNTLHDLKLFISQLKIPHGLKDTEVISYLEWALRNAGFKARIVYGEVENEQTGNETMDTWIVVFLNNGTYFVDNVAGKIVVFNATEDLEVKVNGIEKEYEYEPIRVFENIYSVIDFFGNVDNWDWWNVVGFPPKTS